MESTEQHTGTIKFYNRKNKFGFVREDGTGREIYFHERNIIGEVPNENDRVSYSVQDAKRGPEATEVSLIRENTVE